MTDLFKNVGVEVEIPNDKFGVVRETLTRMGIISSNKGTLTQTAHIFHKQGKYVIAHFKEMLKFDGHDVSISEDDIKRRDSIIRLLEQWGLVSVKGQCSEDVNASLFRVISAKDRNDWNLVSKYTFG